MAAERNEERRFKIQCKKRGWRAKKLKDTDRGFPDWTVLMFRAIAFVEMKKPRGGRLSKQQKRQIEDLRKDGHAAAYCKTSEAALDFCQRVADGSIFNSPKYHRSLEWEG